MEEKNNVAYKIAAIISIVGNPLVTLSIFTLFITTKLLEPRQAAWISFLVIGCVAIPVGANNYWKTKKGHITNFDLSDRKERQTFYPRLLVLLLVVSGILFVTHQPLGFCIGSLVVLSMMTTSYLINFRLKVSMHTSISVFLAVTLFKFSIPGGLFMLAFAFLISFSRLVLKRHTPVEVLAGSVLGLTFGLLNFWL